MTYFLIWLEEYYLGNKNRRGKIAERFYALTKKFKAKGIIEKSSRSAESRKQEQVNRTSTTTNIEPTDVETANYLWLYNNISPESIVFEKWESTFAIRRTDAIDENVDLFEKWPLFTKKIGITLVSWSLKIYHMYSILLFVDVF